MLLLKKLQRVIKFNQISRLKQYIDIYAVVGKAAKNDLKKHSFKLMNNSVFGKTMKNVQNHRNIKLLKTEKEETIWYQDDIIILHIFTEKFLSIEMKKFKSL